MHLLPLPAFDDNYIWTWRDETGRALVVDPGQAGPVLAAAADGLQPIGLPHTHHHDDHIGGVDEQRRHMPARPVTQPVDTPNARRWRNACANSVENRWVRTHIIK